MTLEGRSVPHTALVGSKHSHYHETGALYNQLCHAQQRSSAGNAIDLFAAADVLATSGKADDVSKGADAAEAAQ